MKYISVTSVLVLGPNTNSFLSPSHLFRMDIVVLPFVWVFVVLVAGFLCFGSLRGVCLFLGVLFGFFVVDFFTQLYSFLCFLFCGGMKEGSQLSIFVSKSFKMVR